MFGSVIQQGKNTSTDQEKLVNPSVPIKSISAVDFHFFWTKSKKEMCGLKETVQRAVWDLKTLYQKYPTKIPNLCKIVEISNSDTFSLFLDENGVVWTHAEKFLISIMPLWCKPRKIEGLPPIRAISAGEHHSLFLAKEGRV